MANVVNVEISLDQLCEAGANELGITNQEYRARFLNVVAHIMFGDPEVSELEDGSMQYTWSTDPRAPYAGPHAIAAPGGAE